MTEDVTIEDLEKHSGLSIRTLHYYMQEGLLPGPDKRGKNATYSQEHLDRLDLILALKEMHLPLKEIRALLDRLTPREIRHFRNYQEELLDKLKGVKPDRRESQAQLGGSALDYIKSLEEAHTPYRRIAESEPQALYFNLQNAVLKKAADQNLEADYSEPDQEIWRRIVLADGVELNIRDTRDRDISYKIDRLLAFARSLFTKDQPKGSQ